MHEFLQALSDFEAASDETTRLVREIAAGCTRPATPDESRPVELPKITPPRLPTGVNGEGVPPLADVHSGWIREPRDDADDEYFDDFLDGHGDR